MFNLYFTFCFFAGLGCIESELVMVKN